MGRRPSIREVERVICIRDPPFGGMRPPHLGASPGCCISVRMEVSMPLSNQTEAGLEASTCHMPVRSIVPSHGWSKRPHSATLMTVGGSAALTSAALNSNWSIPSKSGGCECVLGATGILTANLPLALRVRLHTWTSDANVATVTVYRR